MRFGEADFGVGRGKKLHDKREAIKRRDTEREARREMSVKVRVWPWSNRGGGGCIDLRPRVS